MVPRGAHAPACAQRPGGGEEALLLQREVLQLLRVMQMPVRHPSPCLEPLVNGRDASSIRLVCAFRRGMLLVHPWLLELLLVAGHLRAGLWGRQEVCMLLLEGATRDCSRAQGEGSGGAQDTGVGSPRSGLQSGGARVAVLRRAAERQLEAVRCPLLRLPKPKPLWSLKLQLQQRLLLLLLERLLLLLQRLLLLLLPLLLLLQLELVRGVLQHGRGRAPRNGKERPNAPLLDSQK